MFQNKVSDLEQALVLTKDYEKQLYVLMQIALRQHVSQSTIDDILQKKQEVGDQIQTVLKAKANELGITITNSGIKTARSNQKYDIAKFLLKQQSKTRGKLNIDSQNRDGLTVLSILTLAGKNDSIRAICAMPFSANPNLVDRNGRTALTLAARYANEARAGPFPCVWRNGDKTLRVDWRVLLRRGGRSRIRVSKWGGLVRRGYRGAA